MYLGGCPAAAATAGSVVGHLQLVRDPDSCQSLGPSKILTTSIASGTDSLSYSPAGHADVTGFDCSCGHTCIMHYSGGCCLRDKTCLRLRYPDDKAFKFEMRQKQKAECKGGSQMHCAPTRLCFPKPRKVAMVPQPVQTAPILAEKQKQSERAGAEQAMCNACRK